VTLQDLNAKRSKEFEGLTMEAERLNKTEHEKRSKSATDAATSLKSQLSMEQSKNSKLMDVLQNDIKAEETKISMLQSTAMETSTSISLAMAAPAKESQKRMPKKMNSFARKSITPAMAAPAKKSQKRNSFAAFINEELDDYYSTDYSLRLNHDNDDDDYYYYHYYDDEVSKEELIRRIHQSRIG
jgi:predicted HicB family RNase H-like nuclease